MARSKRKTCKTTGCTAQLNTTQPGRRGLCPKCYQALLMAIERGETTWEEAEELGVCLPAYGGRSQIVQTLHRRKAKKQKERAEAKK